MGTPNDGLRYRNWAGDGMTIIRISVADVLNKVMEEIKEACFDEPLFTPIAIVNGPDTELQVLSLYCAKGTLYIDVQKKE